MFLKETYAPKLQATQHSIRLWPKSYFDDSNRTKPPTEASSIVAILLRPFRLLCTSPAVLFLSIYTTISNSYVYVLYTTLPVVFTQTYRSSRDDTSFAYLGLGVGMVIGLLYLLIEYPRISLATRASHDLESLLIMTIPAAVFMPIALFIYGWSIHYHVSSIVPVLATGMVGAAFLTTFVSPSTTSNR